MKFRIECLPEKNQLTLIDTSERKERILGYVCENIDETTGESDEDYDKNDIVIGSVQCIHTISFNDFKMIQDSWNQMQIIRKERGLTN